MRRLSWTNFRHRRRRRRRRHKRRDAAVKGIRMQMLIQRED